MRRWPRAIAMRGSNDDATAVRASAHWRWTPTLYPHIFRWLQRTKVKGSWQQAIDEYKKVIELSPERSGGAGGSGLHIRANRTKSGCPQDNRPTYGKYRRSITFLRSNSQPFSPGLKIRHNSMMWLEKAYQKRESQMPFLQSDDRFNSLHSGSALPKPRSRLELPSRPLNSNV